MAKFRNRAAQIRAAWEARAFHEAHLAEHVLYVTSFERFVSLDDVKSGAEKRMAVVDAMPKEHRLMVHEYGLSKVAEVLRNGPKKLGRKTLDLETSLRIDAIKIVL